MEMRKCVVEDVLSIIQPSISLKHIKENYKDGYYSMAEIVLAIIAYMEEEQN